MTDDPCRPVRTEEILLHAADMIARQVPGVMATVIAAERSTPREAGARMVVRADGSTFGTVGGGAAEAKVAAAAGDVLNDGRCRRVELDLAGADGVCGGRMEVFLEPLLATSPFVVVGAGHVGRALLEAGRNLPLRFRLVDDRADLLAGSALGPAVLPVRAGPGDAAAAVPVEPGAAVVVASRSHELDTGYADALLQAERAAGREFVFFGVLGSAAKTARIRDALLAAGHPAERLDRLQMPVGVEVGGGSPAEIAISVLAEALAVLRGVAPVADSDGRPLGLRLRRRRS